MCWFHTWGKWSLPKQMEFMGHSLSNPTPVSVGYRTIQYRICDQCGLYQTRLVTLK